MHSSFQLFSLSIQVNQQVHQGKPEDVSNEGEGVMNLYLCSGCSASLCLACGTVDVTKDHFYGQVQFNDLKIFVFVDILLISGTSASKCLNMPCGKLWIKTLGRGGGD